MVDIDNNLEQLIAFQKSRSFDPVVICPNKTHHKLPQFFDPSLNGHDFFAKTITCSCVNNKTSKTHKCNLRDEEDGCRRTRKNEYARQQMKKYREKLKQDPVRYMKYLQSERERNSRRKLRKIQKLLSDDNNILSDEQVQKLRKRHHNLLYRARIRFGQEYLVDIKNTQLQATGTLSTINNCNQFFEKMKKKSNKTYENKKKRKLNLGNNNKSKNNNNENNDNKNDELSLNQNLEMPGLHFYSGIFNNGKINPNKATVYEIGNGMGPFTNLKIVNSESDSRGCLIPETVFKNEKEDISTEIKEEPLSDAENDNSTSQDYINFNMDDNDDSLSDTDSQEDNDFKFNRICAIVNCPSRFMYKSDIKYYPFPPQKDIRECWFNLIKTKTNQWIVDPDAFVCSLHFAPTWFQKSPSYGNKMLLLNAVPTIFPNGTASQFDIEIPLIDSDDYHNPETFKNYYKWSCMKLREQENLLKDQQVIIENQTEYKVVQTKRIEKLYKVVDEFKKSLNLLLSNSNSDENNDFKQFIQKVDDIKTDLLS